MRASQAQQACTTAQSHNSTCHMSDQRLGLRLISKPLAPLDSRERNYRV